MSRCALLFIAALLVTSRPGAAQPVRSDQTASPLSLSLDDMVERTVSASTMIRMAEARRDEADAAIGTARAARRPTITASAQFSWQPTANADASGLTWSPDPTAPLEQRVRYLERAAPTAALAVLNPQILASAAEYAWIGGISGQATLIDGGRTRAAVAAATARRDATDAAIDRERARARLDAELAYRQLQLARERIVEAERARETTAQDLEVSCDRWERGLVSELEVLHTEMTLADLERRVASAISAEQSAEQRLRLLADLPSTGALRLTSPVDTVSLSELVATEPSDLLLVAQQADRRSAQAAVTAATAEMRAIRAKRRPSLVLRTDLLAIRAPSEPFALGGAWQDVRTVTAGFQIPIIRAGQRAEERAAEARLAQAEVDARRVADGARLESESARAERERARASWQSAKSRLTAADRAAELTAAAVTRGIATPTDEARSRLDVIEARTTVLEALIDYLSADAVAGEASRAAADQL